MVSEPLGHPHIPAGQPLDIKVLVAYQPQPLTLWPLAWILTGWLEAWRLSWQPLLESDEWFLATDSSVLTACGSSAPSENVHWLLACPGSEPWKVLLSAAKFTPQRGLCLRLEFPPLPIFVRLWGVSGPNSVMHCLDEIPPSRCPQRSAFAAYSLWFPSLLWLRMASAQPNIKMLGKGKEAERQAAHFLVPPEDLCGIPGSATVRPLFVSQSSGKQDPASTLVAGTWCEAGGLPFLFWRGLCWDYQEA